MPAMIISSPSSASFQAGACSSSNHNNHHFSSGVASATAATGSSSSSSALAAASRVSPRSIFHSPSPFAAPAANCASSPTFRQHQHQHRHSVSRSLLSHSVEELRTALKNHSVAATTSQDPGPGPSGDHSRGCMSAGPDTLGGDSRQSLTNASNQTTSANANDYNEAQPAPIPSQSRPQQSPKAEPQAPITATKPRSNPSTTAISPSDVKGKRQLADATEHAAGAANRVNESTDNEEQELERIRLKRLRPPVPAVKLLPRRYEFVHPNDLVILISSMIMELIQYNDTIPLQGGRLTRFHSRTPPRISVRDYLQRLTTHATLSPPILLSMVYYIDRLCALYPAFTVSSLTVHRFLIVSATVASKGLSDSFWTNKTYARVGGITITELAMLELDFLWRVEWKIVPQPEVLVDYYLSLVERCEGYALEPERPGSTSATSSHMEGVVETPPSTT